MKFNFKYISKCILKINLLFCLLIASPLNLLGQEYYGELGLGSYIFEFENGSCGCSITPICNYSAGGNGVTYGPDSILYRGQEEIQQIDPLTCNWSWYFTEPPDVPDYVTGLHTLDGIGFYMIGSYVDALYEINVANQTVTNLGPIGYPIISDICPYNGEIYFLTVGGIVHLDLSNPMNSLLIPAQTYGFYYGLTGSPWCNTLIGIKGTANNREVQLINILDGSISILCQLPEFFDNIISTNELANPAPCELMLDLDCDDSNSIQYFDCLDVNGVPITDDDIRIFADDWLTEMTINIAAPIPDAPDEILIMTGSIPNIDETGSGTSMITLTNAGGATIQDFKDALQLIVYNNISSNPTAGLRTIEVQFTTASGAMSNVAEYFIDVIDLPLIQVDLGPDLEICDGTFVTFNAGNSGSMFEWSTGESSQSITVDQSGQYSVTVSNGVSCPNEDTVELDVLPIITVSLAGDGVTCDNEPATITILTNSPFPLSITIDIDPGSSFVFTNITDDFSFTDMPSVTTEYTITSVIPDQPGCIEITGPPQVIEVFPSYVQDVSVSLCDGDSIWLGFFWESDAGVYENLLQSEFGCDSFVTTYITVLPAENIFFTSSTCDSSSAGVFVTHLNNSNGCDTVVTTTVTLLPSDTTAINLTSCNLASTGISILTLTNQQGCDSLIITTTSWIPPSDTTVLNQLTCDSSQFGVFQQIVPDQTGCDSLIITMVTMAPDDTIHLASTSCDTAAIGVFEMLLSNQMGCDSLIITTVSPGTPDTTLLFATSCDSASLGVFETHFITSNSCDSTVITTISYSAQDSVFITGASCDPSDVGVFISQYINQFGCDSIVTETVSLLPSDAIFLTSTTCDPSAAGVFTHMLTNQFGCDSMVTETVSLLPSDATFLNATTCSSSEAGVFVTTLSNQYGCDSVITETVAFIPTDTTILTFNTCDPAQVVSIETLFTGQDGCDSLVIEATSLFPLPQLDVVSASDFNGYDISCFGESDGSASALVLGIPPYNYIWSTGDTDLSITGLAAGAYQVSVTDGNGCTTEGQIILVEPGAFEISFMVSQPNCFGVQEGSITVQPTGGVAPYRYSIDGTNYQASSDFTGLGEGVYQISSLDANDCITSEIIWINVPLMVEVELGDDQVISKGDSFLLQAIVNIPFDSLSSVTWTGIDSIDCPTCLTQLVAPIITTSYSVSVTTEDGCADKDSLTLFVHLNDDIYVPNIFSPNGDGINDQLIITAGSDVTEIKAFMIFDRWGNMVFLAEHVQADDPAMSWDGTLKGERMNAAVFTYKVVAEFKDGRREVRYGDITLIK